LRFDSACNILTFNMGYTVVQAQAKYDLAAAAYDKAVKASAYSASGAGGVAVTRQQLKILSDEMDKWQRIVDEIQGAPSRIIRPIAMTPVD
jgi:hypothetical protein